MQIDQLVKFSFHKGSVYALAQGQDAASFLSAGSDGIVAQCSIHDSENATAIAKVEGQVFALLLLPEKNHLVIGTMSGGLHVIDLNLRKEIHYITYHEQSIFDIKYFQNQLLVASKDGTLSVWSVADYALQRTLSISELSLRMIDISPDRNEIAIACSDNSIYLVDLQRWKVKSVLHGPTNSVFSVAFLPGTEKLLAGSRDAQLYCYDLKSNDLVQQIKAHLYTINDLELISDNKYIASASRDKSVRIWNTENLSLVKSLDRDKNNGHINSVNRLLWMPLQSVLLSASDDRSIIAWKIED